MSTYKLSPSSKEAENVSTRVKSTKKEIELLKADLEKLISSGVRAAKTPPKETEVPQPIAQPIDTAHRPPAVKKNEAPQDKPEPKKDSPKKLKSYNVAQAREYIKKQKEKRAEQLKAQINVTDNKIDLKKQKLKELHQKTLELVTKNIQLKRERSKSRDREPPFRPDKSNIGKSASQEKFKKSFQENVRPKSQERGVQPPRQKSQSSQQNLRQKSQERVLKDKSQENVHKICSNIQKKQSSQERVALAEPLSQEHSKPVVSGRVSRSRSRPEKAAPGPIFSISGREMDTNLLYPPGLKLRRTDVGGDFEKTTCPSFENKKVSNDTIEIDLNKQITKQQARLEHSLMTDACLKDCKETQTNNLDEPVWLKPPTVLPYPYNFINTVKRKLQYAINSPRSCVDVGVQNSERGTPEIEQKSKEEIRELLVKSAASDLKSFASHKCPNLDLKAVENLELKKSDEMVARNLFVDYDSESDTSKNIPDISSESLVSSQNNRGDSEPILSLHRLKNLKLHPHKLTSSKSSSKLKTESPEWSNNNNNTYSSDFLNESESHKSRPSGTIKTVTGGGKVSRVHSSSNSSIKTVASEKRQPPQFLIPSNIPTLDSNQNSCRSMMKSTENNLPVEDPFSFKSLLVQGETSVSTSESNSDHGSTVSKPTSLSRVEGLALKEPTISLTYKKDQDESSVSIMSKNHSNSRDWSKSSISNRKEDQNVDLLKNKMRNITIRPTISTNNEVNEIHLKFEAEVRLLSDFKESLKPFIAAEKAFENLKSKNDANVAMTKIMQNVDTQTSIVTKTSDNSPSDRKNPTINFSRGSDIIEDLNDSILHSNRNMPKSWQNSSFSTDFDLNSLNRSSNTYVSNEEESKMRLSLSNVENHNLKNCAGLSLNMFEQLIKDEDVRIQHLKAIIKIREQALLDRTKGELVWLEIQRKQLIETGKVEEASLLKKKQRGIILKHEQERNEIKKLKQMQKEASEERKNILKQQRNLIKSQLSTKKMLSKMKVKAPRERRSSGPLRVVQMSCSESVLSETSISRKSSAAEEVLSVTSRSVRISEVESELDFFKETDATKVSNAKRALLMREAALQKRRKAAEELLRWHRKLLDEEKKIAELEAAATSVIKRMPQETCDFNGKQLKDLWRNMTGRDEGKTVEEKACKCTRQSTNKNRKTSTKKSETASEDNYSSIFEPESVQEIINSQEEKTKISSISELIDNFTRIEDEISLLSRKSQLDITSLEDQIEILSKEEDTASQRSTKSSSQASVLRTMTPNHLSEPEDIQTVRTQEIEESVTNHLEEKRTESQTTEEKSSNLKILPTIDQEEIVSEKVVEEETTAQSQLTSVISDKELEESEAIEASSSPKTNSTIEEQEDRKVLEDSTESSVPISEKEEIEASSSPKTESIVDQEITSEKVIEEETTKQSHVASDISSVNVSEAAAEKSTISSKIEGKESTGSLSSAISTQNETKESAKSSTSAVSSQNEAKESTRTTVSSREISKEPSGISETAVLSKEETKSFTNEAAVSSEESTRTEASSRDATTEAAVSSKEKTKSSTNEEIESAVSSEESIATKTSSGDATKEPTNDVSEAVVSSKEKSKTPTDEATESVVLSKEELSEISPLALEEALESASKIEESLSKLNEQLSVDAKDESLKTTSPLGEETEDLSSVKEVQSSDASKSGERTSPRKSGDQIDVKKRVSEILADASGHRGEKSPRVQDLYVTAYDVGAPNLPEFTEPFEDERPLPTDIFGSEAEELWRKQLAIEQEIKQLEQQQKEQLPYVFMREIPNKPPPPYTPPSSLSSLPQSVLPSSVKEISEISDYSSKVLYKAYLNNTLEKVKFSENGFKLFSKVEVPKSCAEFVFNVCRDVARDHYKQFEKVVQPSWLTSTKRPQLAKTKPPEAGELDKIMNTKLRELFGFKSVQLTESAITKWGRKKRDHVDEILVVESQEEEVQWTNFDSDELFVKDQITNDIMKMLIDETASVFSEILRKRSVVG